MKAALKKVEDDLQGLQDQFAAANTKKESLVSEIGNCEKKLDRASQLINQLGGEGERWTNFAKDLGEQYTKLTGDVLLSAAIVAYMGPFTAAFREDQLKEWVKMCQDREIPCSPKPSLAHTLGDVITIRQWNLDGLPIDSFSIDNAVMLFNSRRWPLIIDPQGQANKWIRNMHSEDSLTIIKLTDANYMRQVENCIQYGSPILLEDIGEDLDPSLEPLLLKQVFKQGGVDCIRLGEKTVEFSDQFKFYITTKLRNPHYFPEISVKVTLLNFMITPEGLEDQLLGIVVAKERPDLEAQKSKLASESAENKRILKEMEDTILKILSSGENIVESNDAIVALNAAKDKSNMIEKTQKIAEDTEQQIDEIRKGYVPIAASTQVLFFCISDLANIEPVYQYSLGWFIQLFGLSIDNSEKSPQVAERLFNLNEHFTLSLYNNVCRSLLEKDKLVFSFLLTTQIMASKGNIDMALYMFLLTGGSTLTNEHKNPAPDWLSPKLWDEICGLDDHPVFSGFRQDFVSTTSRWKAIYESSDPHLQKFPGKFADAPSSLARLCMLRIVRPDKIVLGVKQFVVEHMTEKFVNPPVFDLEACYNDSLCTTPLVFILSPGTDPMMAIQKLGESMDMSIDSISLGQGQGPIAEKLISKACDIGRWVVLQNCHLAPSWMGELGQITEALDGEHTHAKFRLWCTTYPSKVFPVIVLQNGVKMTIEPPKGLRANIMTSLKSDPISDPNFYRACSKPKEFGRLVYALCFFHALIQERRNYGPLGWNIPYEFNNSDLRISVRQLSMFLDENATVPFKALKYTVGECNYGGRVTDDKDRRTLNSLLNRCYHSGAVTEESFKLSGSGLYVIPPDGDWETTVAFIDTLPEGEPPEVFGMNDNANITKDNNEMTNMLQTLMLTQSGGGSGGGGGDDNGNDTCAKIAADILSKLPEDFDMEEAMIRYPVKWDDSMNTVVCQELSKFNRLIGCVRNSLRSVEKVIKGLIIMTRDLEQMMNSLIFGTIPVMWKDIGKSYPSLKPLSSYVTDLLLRLEFFDMWLKSSPPHVFWLSGFFFTQAFVTGAKQNFARRYTIPIDAIQFETVMMPQPDYKSSPDDGVYTYGLFFEGARWDKRKRTLDESLPKVLFDDAPIIWFKPVKSIKALPIDRATQYECPVYKTGDRRGVLATTGHSSNFVCFIVVPSVYPSEHWIGRGVALLTQLNQ
mmetsp:Transcript_17941/g.24224  ORF Transcript_17941/g.24224 Transcript_17941/m.24224 type:complete len:1197 (-) Transcript_17941:106-3696(-)